MGGLTENLRAASKGKEMSPRPYPPPLGKSWETRAQRAGRGSGHGGVGWRDGNILDFEDVSGRAMKLARVDLSLSHR